LKVSFLFFELLFLAKNFKDLNKKGCLWIFRFLLAWKQA
jgi:hypothetical protein